MDGIIHLGVELQDSTLWRENPSAWPHTVTKDRTISCYTSVPPTENISSIHHKQATLQGTWIFVAIVPVPYMAHGHKFCQHCNLYVSPQRYPSSCSSVSAQLFCKYNNLDLFDRFFKIKDSSCLEKRALWLLKVYNKIDAIIIVVIFFFIWPNRRSSSPKRIPIVIQLLLVVLQVQEGDVSESASLCLCMYVGGGGQRNLCLHLQLLEEYGAAVSEVHKTYL